MNDYAGNAFVVIKILKFGVLDAPEVAERNVRDALTGSIVAFMAALPQSQIGKEQLVIVPVLEESGIKVRVGEARRGDPHLDSRVPSGLLMAEIDIPDI